jgi:hypothetical protein
MTRCSEADRHRATRFFGRHRRRCRDAARDRRFPAASLGGLRMEAPCKGDKFGENTECHWDPALKVNDPKWKLKKEIVRPSAARRALSTT